MSKLYVCREWTDASEWVAFMRFLKPKSSSTVSIPGQFWRRWRRQQRRRLRAGQNPRKFSFQDKPHFCSSSSSSGTSLKPFFIIFWVIFLCSVLSVSVCENRKLRWARRVRWKDESCTQDWIWICLCFMWYWWNLFIMKVKEYNIMAKVKTNYASSIMTSWL